MQGPDEAVRELVTLAHQGSPAARVDQVAVGDELATETLTGFEQRPTV